MEKYFPFSDYDFFGYLASGLYFWFSLDFVLNDSRTLNAGWTVPQSLFVIAVAYITGHLIAGFAKAINEDLLVARILGRPLAVLMGRKQQSIFFRRLLPRYYMPAPQHTRDLVFERARAKGIDSVGEDLFAFVYAASRKIERAAKRADGFLNLYGLCRNVSMSAGAILIVCLLHRALQSVDVDAWFLIGTAVVMIGMFGRYLKFYRLFVLELINSCAYE